MVRLGDVTITVTDLWFAVDTGVTSGTTPGLTFGAIVLQPLLLRVFADYPHGIVANSCGQSGPPSSFSGAWEPHESTLNTPQHAAAQSSDDFFQVNSWSSMMGP